MAYDESGALRCDMARECEQEVTHLDRKGYAYCEPHGIQRRYSGTPCRKLQKWEINRLASGKPLTRY